MAEVTLILDGAVAEESTHSDNNARMGRLIDAHLDFVWRLVRRLGVAEADLDDATQQVFVATANRLRDIPPNKERTFLYGVALRVAANARRASRRRREANVDVDRIASAAANQEELLDNARARDLLDAILAQMPDDLREVLVLCDIEEATAPSVARLLGIPLGTVASRLRRAREDFLARLDNWHKLCGKEGGGR